MKKFILMLALVSIGLYGFSQDVTDKLADSYSGKKGYTIVKIGPEMFNLAAQFSDDDPSDQGLTEKFKGLVIIVKNEPGNQFAKEVTDFVNNHGYKKIMQVEEDDGEIVNFLAKINDKIYSDLIIHAQGNDEEVLMSIRGDFSKSDIIKMGHSDDNSRLSILRELENGNW